jgi:uncharacterized SAM-binding protein YcdF (DUF218 family)
MFDLKKIVGILLKPGIIVLLLLVYGLTKLTFLHALAKKLRGWSFLCLGIVFFYLFSTAPVPNFLIRHLESQYKPITETQGLDDIKYVVVLSGGMRLNFQVPPTIQLGEDSALRVVEGIRLFHLLSEQAILIMTGDGDESYHGFSAGELMVASAQCMGVPREKLISETNSLNTYASAIEVKTIVKDGPFLLVTSAAHMVRAIRIFQILGMKPIPAPADFRKKEYFNVYAYIPSGNSLTTMEYAIHEYLGLAYLYLWPSRAGK